VLVLKDNLESETNMNSNFSELDHLIKQAYTDEDALKYAAYRATQDDVATIAAAGLDILSKFPVIPYCCAPMNALWVAMIRDNTRIPAHLIAGNLNFNERRIFGDDAAISDNTHPFSISNSDWDGHCWAVFGNIIGDISFFRTALAAAAPDWLREMVLKSFGEGRGLVLGELLSLHDLGLVYQATAVATDVQLTGLVKGAVEIVKSGAVPFSR
jgi:hypothetical protein